MGNWADRGQANDYFQEQNVHCFACGKMIPRRAWTVIKDGEELLFCEPDCERIYDDYCVPRYGATIRWR